MGSTAVGAFERWCVCARARARATRCRVCGAAAEPTAECVSEGSSGQCVRACVRARSGGGGGREGER